MSLATRSAAGKIEVELKCALCLQWFVKPLLLPCGHSICELCAPRQVCLAEHVLTTEYDGDRLSIVSETDSGVCVNSRPSSYLCTASSIVNLELLASSGLALICPIASCKRSSILSERGVSSLPRNRALQSIVERFVSLEMTETIHYCQLCEDRQVAAFRFCEQCRVVYCRACLETCHPMRGALAKHSLIQPVTVAAEAGAAIFANTNRAVKSSVEVERSQCCLEHDDQELQHFCMTCKILVCAQCQLENHRSHSCQPASSVCKTHKAQLSHILKALSQKAKKATESIHNLALLSDKINTNFHVIEEDLVQQFDKMQTALEEKRRVLQQQLNEARERKHQSVKDHVSHLSATLTRSTSLLQFCIEMLKESDPTAFLTVAQTLVNRVCLAEHHYGRDMELRFQVNHDFEFHLQSDTVLSALDSLILCEYKVPSAPIIIAEECQVTNNKVTIVWKQSQIGTPANEYTLEIDDGAQGVYKKVYCGPKNLCTIEGLHFKAVYQARVQAHNSIGESAYSDYIKIQTAPIAKFNFECNGTSIKMIFTNANNTVTCQTNEESIVLCDTGFSRGVHFWQFTIDRCEERAEPSFGIALKNVARVGKLGKDNHSWAMYMDATRSWFLHDNKHSERCDGGIQRGSVIGVRLDCDRGTLCYYLDKEPHGPIAFTNLKTEAVAAQTSSFVSPIFYPAVSLNRYVQVTLCSGLEAPCESDESGDEVLCK